MWDINSNPSDNLIMVQRVAVDDGPSSILPIIQLRAFKILSLHILDQLSSLAVAGKLNYSVAKDDTIYSSYLHHSCYWIPQLFPHYARGNDVPRGMMKKGFNVFYGRCTLYVLHTKLLRKNISLLWSGLEREGWIEGWAMDDILDVPAETFTVPPLVRWQRA